MTLEQINRMLNQYASLNNNKNAVRFWLASSRERLRNLHQVLTEMRHIRS